MPLTGHARLSRALGTAQATRFAPGFSLFKPTDAHPALPIAMNENIDRGPAEQLDERILRHVRSANYQPVKPRVIARQLGLPDEQKPELRRAIRRLAKRGLIEYGAKHIVKPVRSEPPKPASSEPAHRRGEPPAATRASRSTRRSRRKSADEEPDQESIERELLGSNNEDGDEYGEYSEEYLDDEYQSDEELDALPDEYSYLDEDAALDSGEYGTDDANGTAEPSGKRSRRRSPQDEERAKNKKKKTGRTQWRHDEQEEVPAPHDTRLIEGVFRRTSLGHGFVRPEGTTREEGRTQDIYINSKQSLDAASGDRVRVRIDRHRARGRGPKRVRQQGVIVEVLERENYRFVGSYMERGGVGLVQVGGRVFQQPIPVTDPGAKNAVEGDQVVIEMVRFPTHFDDGEAVIVEVLGPRGAPGVDTLAIIREYDLPGEFPEAALNEARLMAERFDGAIDEDRRDLTELTTITIDPADARDFDDAISLERLDNGHWLLGVHIADVAFFVPRDSALDQEARRRGTSVYLPDRVIPMLPEIISNNLASLQPGRVRYTRSVFMEFTPDGICVSTEVVRSAIRSKRRFSYEEVDDYLANPAGWRDKLSPDVFQLLADMRDLAMTLRHRRLDGGAIELTLPEIKITLDAEGRVTGARVVENTVSHQIIEEFMLSANRSVAEMLNERQLHFLRRIHEPPTPIKLRSLTEFVRELGIPCESMVSRFEIKRVIAAVRGEPTEYAVNYAVLRSFQKATYGPKVAGHYALNWDHYCHFTSPIRRYPDLEIHRMFEALDRGERPRLSRGELQLLGDHCSDREQRAEAAERELVKLKLLLYLNDHLGMRMEAVITGVEEFGIFAQGRELPAEGFLSVSSLQDDFYRFDATTHSLVGHRSGHQFRLGDTITVEVAHVDLARRELDFRLVSHEPLHHRPLGPPRKKAKAVVSRRAPRKNRARRKR